MELLHFLHMLKPGGFQVYVNWTSCVKNSWNSNGWDVKVNMDTCVKMTKEEKENQREAHRKNHLCEQNKTSKAPSKKRQYLHHGKTLLSQQKALYWNACIKS
jgi:hypothetical protein